MSWQALRRCSISGSLALAVALLINGTSSAQIPGDIDGNGLLDAADIDLVDPLYCGPPETRDVNADGMLDVDDRVYWLHVLKQTWVGDTNLDGEFNSSDLVQVFAAGKFETGEEARWEQGDWNGDYTFSSGDLVFAFVDGGYEIGPRLLGDYNRNGLLDAGDLDLQAIEMVKGEHPDSYDLNDDGLVNFDDRLMWVEELANTWLGDVNLDGEFTTSDLVQMFVGGKYNTGDTVTWEEGDITGDMEFTSEDFVAIFSRYPGPPPKRPARPANVPEPSTRMLLAVGLILAFSTARRRDSRVHMHHRTGLEYQRT